MTGKAAVSGPSFRNVARQPRILEGARAGAWLLEEFLGEGGSGFVYRASNTALGTIAAVKVLRPAAAGSEAVGKALSRGVRGLAAMSHPNVVRIHDLGRIELADGGSWYISMDLVRGQPIDEWSRSLTGDSVLAMRMQVALDCARGLEAAHGCRFIDETGFEVAGVLHGDLKPANVLVRDEGHPVLVDFMIADVQRLVSPPQGASHRKRGATEDFGTPGYMAPEQSELGVVTPRSDVFGLGMTLFHLFCPSASDPFQEWTRDAFPPGLTTVLFSMIEENPSRRPQTAAEVVRALSTVART
ncbi:MAG: serine/threonine protein kinase [Elusimicrobia bacterium]|nr:serine/threonine protein kinase [Elusimicrobiota bacterium]